MLYDVLLDPTLIETGARILLNCIGGRDLVKHATLANAYVRVEHGVVEGALLVNWHRKLRCIAFIQHLCSVCRLPYVFSSAETRRLQASNKVLVMRDTLTRGHVDFGCL